MNLNIVDYLGKKKIFLFEKLYSEEKDLEIKKLLEHYKQVYEVQFNKDRIRKYYESKKEKNDEYFWDFKKRREKYSSGILMFGIK